MNKFLNIFAIAAMILAWTFGFAAPAHANNPWEGTFTSAKENNGVWTATVKIRQTGVTQTRHFKECRRVTGGYQCRNQVSTGSTQLPSARLRQNEYTAAAAPKVQQHVTQSSGNTTPYAVFHPQRYTRYVPQGRGNIWNLDSEPQMRQACNNAGSDCVVVVAPLRDWQAAVQIAKKQTRWPL